MRSHSLRSYQRVHRGEHAVETEQSKIAREGETYAKQARQRDRTLRQMLDRADGESPDCEMLEALDEQSERQRRNMRTHKNRLKSLERQGLE